MIRKLAKRDAKNYANSVNQKPYSIKHISNIYNARLLQSKPSRIRMGKSLLLLWMSCNTLS